MPLNDVMSPVLAAYFQGKQMREQREEKQNQLALEQQRLQQQDQQFQRQQQQLEKHQGVLEKYNDAMLGIHKSEAEARLKGIEVDRGNAKIANTLHILQALKSGAMQAPTMRANEAEMNPAMIKKDITLPDGTVIPASTFPTTTTAEDQLKAEEKRLTNAKEIAGMQIAGRGDVAEQNNWTGLQRTLAMIGGMNQRAADKNAATGRKADAGELKDIVHATSKITTGPESKAVQQSVVPYEKVLSYEPKVAQGKTTGTEDADIAIAYLQAAHSKGRPNVLELQQIMGSDSFVNRHIASFKEALNGSVHLTDQQRQYMMKGIKDAHETRIKSYDAAMRSHAKLQGDRVKQNNADINIPELLGGAFEDERNRYGMDKIVGGGLFDQVGGTSTTAKPLDQFNKLGYRNLAPGR